MSKRYMGDSLDLVDLVASPTTAQGPGKLQLYSKLGVLTHRDANGIEIPASNEGDDLANAAYLKRFFTALGQTDTKPCDVLWIGDSLIEGFYAGSESAKIIAQATKILQ